MLISVEGTGNNWLEPGRRRAWRMLQCYQIVFAKKSFTRIDWCAGALL